MLSTCTTASFNILFDLQASYSRQLCSINVYYMFRLDSNRWNHPRPCFYCSTQFECVRSAHDYSQSPPSLDNLPHCIKCTLISTITHFNSITPKSPIFRPLEVYARSAYSLTTTGEALMDRTLLNRSLSLETFERHHIHPTTTLHALAN